MENASNNRVFTNLQEKQEKESIKAQKQEVKIEKKGEETSRSPLEKLISYVELAGIFFLIAKFKKPLKKLGSKLFGDIESEIIRVDDALKNAIHTAELALRKAIITQYMLDPIQCYRIGPGIYENLVINGNWNTTIYTHLDSVPASVPGQFNIGTGSGSIGVSSSMVRGLSIQQLGILEYLLASGQKLE